MRTGTRECSEPWSREEYMRWRGVRLLADLNLDCAVDQRDYALFQQDFFGP